MSAPSQDESERRTREARVEPKLRSKGWQVVPFSPRTGTAENWVRHAVAEYPTSNGPADYALFVDGQLLGIVEAKRLTVGRQGVLSQAERYARGIASSGRDYRGFQVPFLYSTNGELVWFHDVRQRLNAARKLAGLHTPDALREMFGRNLKQACEWFERNSNAHPRLRPYQIEANTAIETAIAHTDQRTQAILSKAFRGELVPTEAELARREGRDYEPASVLLERIRLERTRADVLADADGRARSRARLRATPARRRQAR